MQLGDMLVIGEPPARLLRPLAVIADGLHRGFELQPNIRPGISKESCVLCALTVRDVLREAGFERARVAPVATIMWATENGKELHSLGIGDPDDQRSAPADRWVGHLVVVAAGYLIDATLYRAIRPAWSDMSPMIALPLNPKRSHRRIRMLDVLAGGVFTDDERPGYEFHVVWLDNPTNKGWLAGPDRESARRAGVVDALLATLNRAEVSP